MVSLYAGQVLSFQPVNVAEDMMFVSNNAYFQHNKAIKGGIPICWPWFGDYTEIPSHPAHGFVRNNHWQVSAVTSLDNGDTQLDLEFFHTEKSRELWPYHFKLALKIVIGDSLTIELNTSNTGTELFSISEALHTYFKVADINQIKLIGLEDTEYLDKTNNFDQSYQSEIINISEETDRIYLNTSGDVVIDDPVYKRQIKISSSGNQNVVIWNPWRRGAATTVDLQDDDYQSFICVEVANALSGCVEVLPGQSHSLKTNYSIHSKLETL